MRLGVTCRKTQAAKTYFMYKSINGLVPIYVSDLIPPSVGKISTYTLRNQHNTYTRNSLDPQDTKAWNYYYDLKKFKQSITKNFGPGSLPMQVL